MTLADVVSPPVHLHTLFSAFQLGDWAADLALGVQVMAAGLYLSGIRRLARRGRRWPLARTAAFLAGLVVLFVALVSGLAAYDDQVFTAHVVQHLLLMMVAPPLLSLGAPVTLGLQASRRTTKLRLLRVLHSPALRVATAPLVAAPLYYASMWVDMQSSFYPYSLEHPLVHDASHFVMFGLGCLFWWPVIGLDELPRRPHAGVRLAMLGLGMPFESFLAIALMNMSFPVAPEHTLADTRNGGSVFWIGSMAITAVAVLLAALWWMRAEDRLAARADRQQTAGAPVDTADTAWASAWRARTGAVPVLGGPPGTERDPVP